jgi:hypothetical protein
VRRVSYCCAQLPCASHMLTHSAGATAVQTRCEMRWLRPCPDFGTAICPSALFDGQLLLCTAAVRLPYAHSFSRSYGGPDTMIMTRRLRPCPDFGTAICPSAQFDGRPCYGCTLMWWIMVVVDCFEWGLLSYVPRWGGVLCHPHPPFSTVNDTYSIGWEVLCLHALLRALITLWQDGSPIEPCPAPDTGRAGHP